VRAYQTKRAAKVSPRTVNLETKVLRLILRRARLWARIADDFKSLREDKRGPGRALSTEQERKLFEELADANLGLEQEKIPHSWAVRVLRETIT
jgi:hypothetical protein